MIATLAGGKRDYDGVDLIFRKRYSNNWQALLAYTYNRDGATAIRTRRPTSRAIPVARSAITQCLRPQPGSITSVFKAAGLYHTAIGVLLGASYRWNSGAYSSQTYSDFGRNLPLPSDVGYPVQRRNRYVDPGWRGRYPAEPVVGPARFARRIQEVLGGLGTEFFVDIFNVTNNQTAIRIQDLVAGSGGTDFKEPTRFLDPQRFSSALVCRSNSPQNSRLRGRLSSGAGPFFVRVTLSSG